MENYHRNEFEPISSVLNDFSTDMFDSITFIMRPVVGGIDHLRSMHQAHVFKKGVNKISNLDFETREKILDILSDLVVDRTSDEGFIKDIEKKISELDEINEVFKDLNHKLSNIDPKQMRHIFKLSFRKLNGRIVSIRDEIRSNMWEDSESISQLLILDQYFFLIQESVKRALDNPMDMMNDPMTGNKIVYSLLYVEAFHRNKVTYNDFQNLLTDLSLLDYIENKSSEDSDAVFEALVV